MAAPAQSGRVPDAELPEPALVGDEAYKGFDPIIVTARRREEELQRTPVSVISLAADELEARSLTNLRSLQNFVPNVTFAPSQNVGDAAGNAFIRGIGQEDFLAAAEPGVGFYLDGVYVARTMGTLMDLIDIARIEVLRGPQGTLYGKNTIGGSINVLSVEPRPEFEAYADLIAGNLGRLELRGMINAPLTDRLFLRLAAGRSERDGYLKRLPPPFAPTAIIEANHDPEGRDRRWAGRVQLRWLASESVTVDLTADASQRRGTQGATHVDAFDTRFGALPTINSLIRNGALPGPEISNALLPDDWLESFAGGNNKVAQDVEGIAATITKAIDRHSVRLIAAYRGLRSDVATDLDGLWFAVLGGRFAERHRQLSAELQASGTFWRLTYTSGLFALRERTRVLPVGTTLGGAPVLYFCDCFYTPANRPRPTSTQAHLGSNSYAAYAQTSLRLTDFLSATLGGRFSYERKFIDEQLRRLDPDTLELTDLVAATGANRAQWRSFTWRAGLEFQATPDLMFYASAAKGYKSGGFNSRPVVNLPNLGLAEFAPETAVTYEAGVRSEWFGRRVRFNATLFHTDYRNIQLRRQTISGGVLTTLIENASHARVHGVEVEVAAKLTGRLTANLAYGNLDARYLDVGRVPGLTLDSEFQRTPRHSFSVSLDYSRPFGDGRLAFHGDYGYRSREQFQLLASPLDQSGYGLLGARVSYYSPGERWWLALFGTNLTDKRYRTAGRGPGINEVGIANSSVGLPRQVAVELKVIL